MILPFAVACRLRPLRTLSRTNTFHSLGSLWSRSPYHEQRTLSRRNFSNSQIRSTNSESSPSDPHLIYQAPLASTFRNLKLFSLSSLSLSVVFTPLIFIIESNSQLPGIARIALACLTVGTSSITTALVAWVSKPYVNTLRRIDPEMNGGINGLELVTASWRLQTRVTRVYDTSFLTTTHRPFAKWELAEEITVPLSITSQPHSATFSDIKAPASREETVAETFDANGNLLGSWVVTWDAKSAEGSEEGGGTREIKGTCRAVGTVVKHFQVHPELFETT